MKKSTAIRFKNLTLITFNRALLFKKPLARAFIGTVFLCCFFGVSTVVNGQYGGTYFITVDPYANNGCIGSNHRPEVHTVNDPYGGTTPPSVLATFTGGTRVGSYFSSCMGMIGYATSHTSIYSTPTLLQNKLKVNFHKPVYFDRVDIHGKYPQRVKVSIDGGRSSVEIDLDDDYPQNDGKGRKAVYWQDFPGITSTRFSTLEVSSDDPNYRFGIYSIHYYDPTPRNAPPSPSYCNVETAPRPAPENLSAYGWTMRSEVSDVDGLVLSDVRLNGRLMAERISVPYYQITTNQSPSQRGELRPNDSGGPLQSRLVSYRAETNDERLIIKAIYAIKVSASQSCLNITQNYEFEKKDFWGICAPDPLGNGHLASNCNRWRASVTYNFKGNSGESLQSLNIAQRNHFKVNDKARNSVGLFTDCDNSPPPYGTGCLPYEGALFKSKLNPLFSEHYSVIIKDGQSTRSWDNIHQTYRSSVSEPGRHLLSFRSGGCPECVHSHWRWGTHFEEKFGGGKALLSPNSNQDLSIGIVRYRAGEEHPNNLLDLLSFTNPEPIRSKLTGLDFLNQDSYKFTIPEEVVYWSSATGRRVSDEFFGYYSFFIPDEPNQNRTITRDDLRSSVARNQGDSPSLMISQDAPSSIIYGHLYKEGLTRYTERDPDTIAQLPNGYAQYNNVSYDIRTEALVSGPHIVNFDLPSVTDQATFDSLRVLHSEPSPVDSSQAIWVDRTILPPNTPAPNFANRTISAKVNEVGPFVIVRRTSSPPPNTNVAELSLSIAESADPIIAGNNLIYTVSVTNNGTDMATRTILSNGLSPDVSFVSADAGMSRFCREENGTVVCDLSSIAPNVTIPVTVTVKPNEGMTRFPPEGKAIVNTAFVTASEIDPNENNNTAIASTNALPHPNVPPGVQIQTPTTDTMLTGPATFDVIVKGIGSTVQIELFDNGESVGSVALTSPYGSIARTNVPFGEHSLVAVATSSDGRKAVSNPVSYFVNGPATVALDSPLAYDSFGRPANVTLTATAVNQSGSISQVEFTANGEPIGNGVLSGTNQYNRTWSNAPTGVYSVRAVATDGNGVKSYSHPAKIYVTDAPTVSITSPATGTSFAKPANIVFTVEAVDFDGYVSKVEFFSNGQPIESYGNGTLTRGNTYNFTWPQRDVPGNYAITAVATDNVGNTTVSAPVNLTITNVPPVVSMTSPANGAAFTAPAAIALSANASDSDGFVDKVEFFKDSTLLGSVRFHPYEFSWNNVIAGSYNLTAKATDYDGAFTVSNPISITVNPIGNALLVVGNTTLNNADNALKTRLQNLGLNVVVKAATAAVSADAAGKLVIVISDTVSPTNVNTKFRAVTVPVVTLDPQLFDDMGMTATTSGNFGTTATQKNVTITDVAHQMAAGLSGTVQVTSGNTTFAWGIVNANAAKIATLTTDATKATSFGYEANAAMPGLNAPARRAGFFYTASSSALTANGGLLFDNAVKWAAGL